MPYIVINLSVLCRVCSQYFVYIYFFPPLLPYSFCFICLISRLLCIGTVFMLCLCFCSGMVIGTCATKPALWLIRFELDSTGSCLLWEYFGLLAYLWAGCGNVRLILVVNIVTCLLLKGYTFHQWNMKQSYDGEHQRDLPQLAKLII